MAENLFLHLRCPDKRQGGENMGEEARELKVFESGHCFHNNSSIQCSSDGSKQAQFCYMAKFVKEEKEEGEKKRVGRGGLGRVAVSGCSMRICQLGSRQHGFTAKRGKQRRYKTHRCQLVVHKERVLICRLLASCFQNIFFMMGQL